MPRTNSYSYQPLSPGKNIRVLILHPSQYLQDPIRCSLREITLARARWSYDALSYVWGSPERDCHVYCNGCVLFVTPNCLSALRHLRRARQERILWMDAICIDQSSILERNHQVQIMGDVYKFARKVLLWLGEGTPDGHRLIRRVRRFAATLRYSEQYCSLRKTPSPKQNRLITAAIAIFSNEWLRRIWTLQEFVLASDAVICYGSQSVKWGVLVSSIMNDHALSKDDTIDMYLATMNTKVRAAVQSSRLRAEGQWILGEFHLRRRNLRSRPKQDDLYCRDASIFLLVAAQTRETFDPRDKIYGLYSMFIDIGINLPPPDYRKTAATVFEEFTFGLIAKMRSFYILSLFEDALCGPGLPSWVINMTALASLLQPLEKAQGPTFREGFQLEQRPGTLVVEGVIFGALTVLGLPICSRKFSSETLSLLSAAMEVGGLARKLRRLGNCPDGRSAEGALFDVLAKTCRKYDIEILGNQISQTVDETFKRMLVPVMQKTHPDIPPQLVEDAVETIDWPGDFLGPGGEKASVEAFLIGLLEISEVPEDFILSRLEFFRINRAPFRRTPFVSNNCVGFAGKNIKDGDTVALLYGAEETMILRPCGEKYRLIGFAAIEGLPDGAQTIRPDRDDTQKIVLV